MYSFGYLWVYKRTEEGGTRVKIADVTVEIIKNFVMQIKTRPGKIVALIMSVFRSKTTNPKNKIKQ